MTIFEPVPRGYIWWVSLPGALTIRPPDRDHGSRVRMLSSHTGSYKTFLTNLFKSQDCDCYILNIQVATFWSLSCQAAVICCNIYISNTLAFIPAGEQMIGLIEGRYGKPVELEVLSCLAKHYALKLDWPTFRRMHAKYLVTFSNLPFKTWH